VVGCTTGSREEVPGERKPVIIGGGGGDDDDDKPLIYNRKQTSNEDILL